MRVEILKFQLKNLLGTNIDYNLDKKVSLIVASSVDCIQNRMTTFYLWKFNQIKIKMKFENEII